MDKHFEEKHSGVDMPPAVKEAIKLGIHEKDHVVQLLKLYKAKDVCKDSKCACRKKK